MWKYQLGSFAFYAFSLLIPGLSFAQGQNVLPYSDGVQTPFPDDDAVKAFQLYVLEASHDSPVPTKEIPPEVIKALPTISYWGYSAQPSTDHGADMTFVQRFSGIGIVRSIREQVAALKRSGCSHYHAGVPSITVADKSLSFRAGISGSINKCADTPLGEVKVKVGSVGGSATGSVSFEVIDSEEVARFKGRLKLNDPLVNVGADVTGPFGLNMKSVVGQLLGSIVNVDKNPVSLALLASGNFAPWAIYGLTLDGFRDVGGAINVADLYLASGNGAVDSIKYNQFLDDESGLVWSYQARWIMDPVETKFLGPADSLQLQVLFRTQVRVPGKIQLAVSDMKAELRLIRSFSEKSHSVTVEKGDSWARLAKRYYGSTYLGPVLREHQDFWPKKTLLPGQSVLIVPYYYLGKLDGRYVVRPGDTAVDLCKRWDSATSRTCVVRLRRLNRWVGDWRRLPALSVIRVAENPMRQAVASGAGYRPN